MVGIEKKLDLQKYYTNFTAKFSISVLDNTPLHYAGTNGMAKKPST